MPLQGKVFADDEREGGKSAKFCVHFRAPVWAYMGTVRGKQRHQRYPNNLHLLATYALLSQITYAPPRLHPKDDTRLFPPGVK